MKRWMGMETFGEWGFFFKLVLLESEKDRPPPPFTLLMEEIMQWLIDS